MTNLYGTAAPTIGVISVGDTGPLQIAFVEKVAVPCVVTHMRFYVASTLLAGETGGAIDFDVWRDGEAASVSSGTLTIPATIGWVTEELTPHLQVPAGRRVVCSINLPSSGNSSYAATFNALPVSNALVTGEMSYFKYQSAPMVTTNPYADGAGTGRAPTAYFLDLEVAVSEFINLDPASLAVADRITVRRNTTGDVTAITPITDALTVSVDVIGGPLDGTNVDVWIPDTNTGLAAADMRLLKELPDPGIGSEWEAPTGSGGDGSLWVYIGGGVYTCFQDGTSFSEGAKTTRADTPSLIPWS